MGVERQTAKVNWFTSLAMIVTAGTLYRLRHLLGNINKISIRELKERAGLLSPQTQLPPAILPRPPSQSPAHWQQTLRHRQQYRWLYKCYTFSEGPFSRKQ